MMHPGKEMVLSRTTKFFKSLGGKTRRNEEWEKERERERDLEVESDSNEQNAGLMHVSMALGI